MSILGQGGESRVGTPDSAALGFRLLSNRDIQSGLENLPKKDMQEVRNELHALFECADGILAALSRDQARELYARLFDYAKKMLVMKKEARAAIQKCFDNLCKQHASSTQPIYLAAETAPEPSPGERLEAFLMSETGASFLMACDEIYNFVFEVSKYLKKKGARRPVIGLAIQMFETARTTLSDSVGSVCDGCDLSRFMNPATDFMSALQALPARGAKGYTSSLHHLIKNNPMGCLKAQSLINVTLRRHKSQRRAGSTLMLGLGDFAQRADAANDEMPGGMKEAV